MARKGPGWEPNAPPYSNARCTMMRPPKTTVCCPHLRKVPPMPAELLAFDVNETLLDLRALDPLFEAVFGDASLRPAWFQTMLQLSFVGGLTHEYVDFTTAQHAALQMIAQRSGLSLTQAQAESIVGGMRRLPPHPEVPAALRKLKDAGFRQVTLTNSTLEVAKAQVE